MSATTKKFDILSFAKEKEINFIDFRFTDNSGKWHHVTRTLPSLSQDEIEDGLSFDGSSIKGWREINESDMIMLPDLDSNSHFVDPFTAHPTLVVFCDVFDPKTHKHYDRCSRNIAQKSEAYVRECGIADTVYFGPEAEFFIFDDVRFENTTQKAYYYLDSEEGPYNSGRVYESGNLATRPGPKGGYFPVQPVDGLHDMRAEMVNVMEDIGLEPLLMHHEVAPAQHELGIKFSTLTNVADRLQKYKYVVKNVAASYGKSATFMPKPLFGDNGSGMHVHQSLWKNGKNLFSGKEYADLSEDALYYIGGVIKHAKALNAFTNPSTNSYKRLVPGYEAPVILAYSAFNRSAAIRIPYSKGEKAKRIEVRFPDPSANPYLAFSAMLMAGIDGIKNKIHPGEAASENLYELTPAQKKKLPHVSHNLFDAIHYLLADKEFLLAGGVFTEDFINSYAEGKLKEAESVEMRPHPMEFEMYYNS